MQDLENEEWRDIPNYDGLYQVSNMGRVKSLPRTYINGKGAVCLYKGKILNPTDVNIRGHKVVSLSCESKINHFSLGRLVAICFLDGFNDEYFVGHKDGDLRNNKISNLAIFTSHKEWAIYGENNGSAKYNDGDIDTIRNMHKDYSYTKLKKAFGNIVECALYGRVKEISA